MSHPAPEELGPPSLRLGFLHIWIYGRQYPDARDKGDGNWLNVAVHCGRDGASVWATGALLDVVALATFREEADALYKSLAGEATLESDEPNVRVHIASSDHAGHLQVRVEITPDNVSQGHWFEFEADQSYLPMLIAQLDSVLKRFPARGIEK